MGGSRLPMFLMLGFFVTALVWGTNTCLHHLNRYLDPPRPIRAVEFKRLDNEHLLFDVLGVNLTLAVPRDAPRWSPPTEPLPALDLGTRR